MANKLGSRLRVNRSRSLLLVVVHLNFVLFFTFLCCEAISRETEAAMRDFSKLRMEKHAPTAQIENPDSFEDQDDAASEDMEQVRFKPSHPDTNIDPRNPTNSPIEHQGEHRSNHQSPEDHPDSGVGGFFPSNMQFQNPNFSHRPLIGGPGLEDDTSSVGVGIGPSGYYSTENNDPNGNKNNVKPEFSDNPDDDNQDVYFIPQTPSPDFLSGIENAGEVLERGYGGLFDGDSNDADSDDNEHNPEGYFGGGLDQQQQGQSLGHNSLYNSDDSADDGTIGYGTPGGVGNPGYNLYDHADADY